MMNVRLVVVPVANLANFSCTARYSVQDVVRCYSSFPSSYVSPIYKKDEQEAMYKTDKAKEMAHLRVKPAFTSNTSSEFHDALVRKFTNYVMRDGRKVLSRELVEKTFENVKRIQLRKYNSASDDSKERIELDPKVILHNAIVNCTPVLELRPIRKGGINYQVPSPVNENRALFLSMNWLIRAAQNKEHKVHFPEMLARELIDAAENKGRVVKQKQEMHKQCEENRAYAHFRWQ